ncbi:glycoprotease family-domain-containing protein [Cristinia sonorae]|uniref:N(6)-L-threonylcarbamoyladenine synthase n=1 Tax=Cristinia sonorae TaxID=1940300 RepID=A0A8K0UY61_9AGAR|nr:glycoprotease family-domain-containing protein [Cristinia sonorae]
MRSLRLTGKYKKCSRLPSARRHFTVLALESSADDTCAAVVTSDRRILSNVVVKQHKEHEKYGGIHPFVAIEAHQRNMPGAVRRALDEAKMNVTDVDGIAFTRGPGMGGCLSVNANAAKTLAAALNKPLVGVHHMQAHALTPLLTSPPDQIPKYPFLTLLISGGHTLLLLARSPTSFETLATTNDESIGQTFDSVSKLLQIPWSSLGPGDALEKFCLTSPDLHDTPPVITPPFPRPMPKRLQFSYACLHSHVERYVATKDAPLGNEERLALARAFQRAAVGQLEEKVLMGLERCQEMGVSVGHLVVSGGVASNMFLRERLRICLDLFSKKHSPIRLVFPPPSLCTDNAVMIAWASMHRFLAGDYDDYSVTLRSKWKIEDLLKTDEELAYIQSRPAQKLSW